MKKKVRIIIAAIFAIVLVFNVFIIRSSDSNGFTLDSLFKAANAECLSPEMGQPSYIKGHCTMFTEVCLWPTDQPINCDFFYTN